MQLLKESVAVRDSISLGRFHRRIIEKTSNRSAAPVKIVAFGDSVTQGIGPVDVIYHDCVYHRQLLYRLERRYPLCTFSTINAGVDGESAYGGLLRLDRDVITHQPDLLIVAFGLNEAVSSGRAGLDAYSDQLATIIERTRSDTSADIVLMTPNFMVSRHNDRVADCHAALTDTFIIVQSSGLLEAYADRVRSVGARHDVPVADLYAAWQALADRGVDTTAMLANGLNHPNEEGHALAADVLWKLIGGSA